ADRDRRRARPDRVLALAVVAQLAAADRLGAEAFVEAGVAGGRTGLGRALLLGEDVADAGDELARAGAPAALRTGAALGQVRVVTIAGAQVPADRAHVRGRAADLEVVAAGLAGLALAQGLLTVPHAEATGDVGELGQIGEALALT